MFLTVFSTQSRKGAKKNSSCYFAPLRLCVEKTLFNIQDF